MKNYYEILGLTQDASKEEIREAYKRLAIKYHPDRNENEQHYAELFKDVSEAKSVLYNDERKAEYDVMLSDFYLAQNKFVKHKKLKKVRVEKKKVPVEQKRRSSGKVTFSNKRSAITGGIVAVIAGIFVTIILIDENSASPEIAKRRFSTNVPIEEGRSTINNTAVNVGEKAFEEDSKSTTASKKTEQPGKSKFRPPVTSNAKNVTSIIKLKATKKLQQHEMADILSQIVSQTHSSGNKTNCIKVFRTKSSNVENAFDIASYLRKHGFIISGREIVKDNGKGIDIDTSESCTRLTIGTL